MSKALFVCYKTKSVPSHVIERLETIEEAILPDNLTPNNMDLVVDNRIISCIFNPVALKQREGKSICLGMTSDNSWWIPRGKNCVLEGSYSIFRVDDKSIELQTDAVASRAIWYYLDDDKIIASNSQLAIIYFLGDYKFNEEVIPWMLSSGTLGPYLSWDSRIKLLRPQSTLKLDKDTWEVKIDHEPITFYEKSDEKLNVKQQLESLSREINRSIRSLPSNKNLLLPLSGGYDSRGILLSLEKSNKEVPTITWGSRDAINHSNNDAFIAKKLAEFYNLNHTYVHTEDSKIDVQTVIDRFLINSEGRTDNIGGYMDGFKIWEDIFNDNHVAIIRGDEGFGINQVYTEQQARTSIGINLASEFNKLKNLGYKQSIPDDFTRRKDESIMKWRDRLFQSLTTPIFYSALNETKSSYVEIINPLQSYSILKLIRTLPDKLRTNKKLFKMYVEYSSPPIPFATQGANINYRDQLRRKDILDYLIQTIKNNNQELIDSLFINELINEIINPKNISFKKYALKRLINLMPNFILFHLRGIFKSLNHLDNNLLLFRVFIIYKMNQNIKNILSDIEQ